MAVPAGPTEKRYTGNGVTTIFTIPFLLLAASDLDVFLDGVEIVSDFTIAGVGNPTSTITFTTAPPNLSSILLNLNVPFERLNDYQENGDFLSSTVNRDFDRIWQALKQLYRVSTRSLTLGFFDVDGAGWYRAKGNGIRDLADPVLDQDAVNVRTMRSMIEQALAGVIGGTGWFLQFGLGAIARTFQDKMRDQYSVKDFGAKLDGVTDDTAAIQAAVTAAIAAIKRLYWPDGRGVLSGNIDGFHQVKHFGPGAISREGSVFYISPLASQTNNLYLAVAGSDSNDGLSPSYPRLTLAGSGTALSGFGPFLEGTWVVNLAAGQYNESNFTVPPGLRGRNPIYFKGPVSVHPAPPMAIVDGGGTGAFGIQLNRQSTVYLIDLLFRNFTTYGIVGQDLSILYSLRTHVSGVPGGAAVKMQQGRVNWIDGRVANSQQGFSFIAGCTFTVTASDPTLAKGTLIENNTQAGVQAQEQSSGHVDFALVAGNPIGYRLTARSRVHSASSRITGCVTCAVQGYGSSDWYNNNSVLDANSTAELLYTGSIEVAHYQNNVSPTRRPLDSSFVTHTGTTAATTLKTYTDALTANNFWNSTKSMRFVLNGELSGTAGNKNITVNIDGSTVLGFTIPAAATGSYVIDGTLTALATTQQTYNATCMVNGQALQVASGARGIAMNGGAAPVVTVVCTLVSAADSLTIRTVSLFET